MSDRKIKDDRKRRAAILTSIVGNDLDASTRAALEASEGAEEAARFIREMRHAAALTQSALAERLGVNQARISEIERGGTPEGVSYALLRRVAIACGFPDWPASPLPDRKKPAVSKRESVKPALDPVRVTVVTVDAAREARRDRRSRTRATNRWAAIVAALKSGSPQEHVMLVDTSQETRRTGTTVDRAAPQGQADHRQDQWRLIRDALVSRRGFKVLDEA